LHVAIEHGPYVRRPRYFLQDLPMGGVQHVSTVAEDEAELACVPRAAGDEAQQSSGHTGFAQQVELLGDDGAAEAERDGRVQGDVGDDILVDETGPAHGLSDSDDKFYGRSVKGLRADVRGTKTQQRIILQQELHWCCTSLEELPSALQGKGGGCATPTEAAACNNITYRNAAAAAAAA
jgi:hypothetical protein